MLNREKARQLMPVIKALAEGKDVEFFSVKDKEWKSCECLGFTQDPKYYRVAPDVSWRPFANNDECWAEMLRHEPFGWLMQKSSGLRYHIGSLEGDKGVFVSDFQSLESMFEEWCFVDGSPFGVVCHDDSAPE